MFQKFSFILTGALALTMVAGCERADLSNPNYDPETNSVVTNFVFNVSTATGKTKQSDAAVQASSSNPFRGIKDAILLTYALGEGENNKILTADADAVKEFDLAEVASAGSLSSTESRRVLEMSLPLNTNTMLFYGRAIPNSPASDSDKDDYGYLENYSISATAGSGLFTLGKRLQDTGKFYATEKLFAGIFSVIMNTNLKDHPAISKDASPVGNANKYKFDIAADAITNISWSSYNLTNSPIETSHSPYPLEVKLANAYKQMTSINTAGGELRAGSGYAILRTIQDLWSVINGVRCAEPLNEAEAVAKYLANEIFIRIGKYFYADSTPGDGAAITGVAFQTMSDITTAFQSAAEVAARPAVSGQTYDWPSDAELSSIASVVPADFPFNFNLPRGASHYGFNTTNKAFYYPSTFNTSGMGGVMEGGQFNAESYFYPAELLYFGNSPIRTSDSEHKVSDYPQGSGTDPGMWSNDGSWDSDWNGASVKASTRSVAMKHNINYGTALLASQVKYGSATLKDNNRAVQAEIQGVDPASTSFTEVDNIIPVDASSFKFTGIIVGGQSQNVGWDFLPIATGSTPKYTYGFVYDKSVPTAAQTIPAYTTAGSPSAPNYTMLFDNFKGSGQTAGIWTADTQDKVYVALEFQNLTGHDFYGNHNLIRNEGYFYLIAELNPASVTAPAWPTNYILPPYNADGTSNQIARVFMQDYLTSATFTLGENSLKHAYLTVPDLRAGSLTLGLSVDINWSTGLVFNDVILGGN
ncbi:MAG: hypothetical protein J6U34_02155 [Bacteroidales bacterium]|nr:hypothetical protein [Bacteroidales bacterium]